MRTLCILFVLLLVLTACGMEVSPVPEPEPPSPSWIEPVPEASAPDEEETPFPAAYLPREGMSAEETVTAYFEQQYLGYLNLQCVDISGILYLEDQSIRNLAVWMELLAMRRRLISEQGYCYVETEEFPYTITFIGEDELRDERASFFARQRDGNEGEVLLHFEVAGEKGRAYPPFLAVNSQHTMGFVEEDGVWKVSFHYYPGSVRSFVRSGLLFLPSEAEMRADLALEFAHTDSGLEEEGGFDGEMAAEYALKYTEEPNPDFYRVGDWNGDCANFTSQCISYGFGGAATEQWYGGASGGTSAWENVDYFWDYAVSPDGMSGHVLEGVSEVRAGDLIQTAVGNYRTTGGFATDDFKHSLLVVDEETLFLAQNSPANFVYYSDIVNNNTRFVRPVSLAP